ncbi:MAG: VWA domain-containing protein [Myxococcales bacterium]|nr:VWA domain-containing protein [Myxococcales bacterium]
MGEIDASLSGDGLSGVNPVPTPGQDRFGTDVGGASDTGASWNGGVDAGSWQADTGSFADDAGASDAGASDAGSKPDDDAFTGGNTGLSQAGAQDFGLFRQILEQGGIPSPNAMDDLGFFAEHKLDYPNPTCGQNMCMHALLGEMGNLITGSTCTLIQIGLNTPIKVSDLKRPPLHVVLAIDTSGSMAGKPLTYVIQGLSQMLDNLQPKDHVTLVTFSGTAKTVFEHLGVKDKAKMQKAVIGLKTGAGTHLYDGLFTAFAKAAKHASKTTESRVVLLSDGQPTTGIAKAPKFVSLAKGYAVQGIGITTIGVGTNFSIKILRDIAEVGAGNFYFLDKPAAVKEVFTEEVKTFLVPIALDVKMAIDVGDSWIIREGYGTHGWKGKSGGGDIHIPSLFLAGRLKSDDPLPTTPGTGRRGGGGAILIEAMPFPGIKPKTTQVGTVKLSWKHPTTGKIHTQTQKIDKKAAKIQIADGGIFTNKTVEKGFVMLNLFVGFQQASQLAVDGDPGAAIGTLLALKGAVQGWLDDKKKAGDKPDPDIKDDLVYVDLFLTNLKKLKYQTPISKPPEPWPKD